MKGCISDSRPKHNKEKILYTCAEEEPNVSECKYVRPVGLCVTAWGDLWLSEQIDLHLDTGTGRTSHWLIYEEASYFARM